MKTPPAFYCGIDPGWKGAIAVMNAAGTALWVYDMPVELRGVSTKYKSLDLIRLREIFKQILAFPDVSWSIEQPTTRPDEGAERSARFGRQLGVLETMAFMMKADYRLISPMKWKNGLSLPGKTKPNAKKICTDAFDIYYPAFTDIIRGKMGGLKDGRLDALLICHYSRTRSFSGAKSIVDRFGKGSTEALAFVLTGGRNRYRGIS